MRAGRQAVKSDKLGIDCQHQAGFDMPCVPGYWNMPVEANLPDGRQANVPVRAAADDCLAGEGCIAGSQAHAVNVSAVRVEHVDSPETGSERGVQQVTDGGQVTRRTERESAVKQMVAGT